MLTDTSHAGRGASLTTVTCAQLCRLEVFIVNEMNVNWEEDFVVLHELLRTYHVLRRFRDEQSYIVWLGRAAATAKREKKIARIFNLCDV